MTGSREYLQAGRSLPGVALRHGHAGRWSGLAGIARHGRSGGSVRPGKRGTVCARLRSGDALCGPLSDAGLLRGEMQAAGAFQTGRAFRAGDSRSCRAVDSGVSWAALRPEDAGAERLPVCRDGFIQRGDFALRDGADLCGATCLRSDCDRVEPSANRGSFARDGPAGGIGAGLCSAGRAWGGHVQPGDAILLGCGRHAARGAAGTEEDWRMERAEGRGPSGFSARVEWLSPCGRASHGDRRRCSGGRRGHCAWGRHVVR